MASDVRTGSRSGPVARSLAVAVLAGMALTGTALPASAQAAATSTDVSVQLTNAVDAQPGKRVSYQVLVHNKGPHTAKRVRIDFTTTASMKSIKYTIYNGHCHRAPRETTCVFYASLKSGASKAVTISGVISKKLKKGTPVTNRVRVTSGTHLTNVADDVATDNYRIGIPRVAAALPAPTPSERPGSKLLKINDATARVFGYGQSAVKLTFLVLAAAALWFALGLTLRHRKRRREDWEEIPEDEAAGAGSPDAEAPGEGPPDAVTTDAVATDGGPADGTAGAPEPAGSL
ncbi:MAG TPA: hypothetical protein VKB69_05815, partial [Micromonosporaceae bacterium]|nr:hypothetical protein [Micromonosporaceae bacterium]